MVTWTPTQAARLRELDADDEVLAYDFADEGDRNRDFQGLEARLVADARQRLTEFRQSLRQPAGCRLASLLTDRLVHEGFVQVATPTIMARGHLERMGIDAHHPLSSQIFWLDRKTCLRPMLAPHLYFVLKDLLRIWEHPVRIFEIGSCFRKETKGSRHTSEFTMLNVVEMGLPLAQRRPRLEQVTEAVMTEAGISGHKLVATSSEVYGETIDIEATDGMELGSAAMGPHPLDNAWRIQTTWIGVGFGIERLLMAAGGRSSLGRLGRSLTYLDGISLSV
jgi:phenylalanyl-tRNA synthetase alpha chain